MIVISLMNSFLQPSSLNLKRSHHVPIVGRMLIALTAAVVATQDSSGHLRSVVTNV